MAQWIRVGNLLVADDETTAGNILNSTSLTRAALDELFDKTQFATQSEAVAGAADGVAMSPLRSRQAFNEWLNQPLANAVSGFRRAWSREFDVNVRNSTSGLANISFPSGRFTAPPVLAVTRATAQQADWVPFYGQPVDTDGATIGVYNTGKVATTVTIRLGVVAIQPG